MVAVGVAALALGLFAPGGSSVGAQLLPSTTEPQATTEPVPETTEPPPETTETPTTAPPETAPPTTAPPATRAPATTSPPTTAPPETTTTAPPDAPPTIPVTTVPVEGRARITQDTPDLGGVLTLWGLGILGTVTTLAWGWRANRP